MNLDFDIFKKKGAKRMKLLGDYLIMKALILGYPLIVNHATVTDQLSGWHDVNGMIKLKAYLNGNATVIPSQLRENRNFNTILDHFMIKESSDKKINGVGQHYIYLLNKQNKQTSEINYLKEILLSFVGIEFIITIDTSNHIHLTYSIKVIGHNSYEYHLIYINKSMFTRFITSSPNEILPLDNTRRSKGIFVKYLNDCEDVIDNLEKINPMDFFTQSFKEQIHHPDLHILDLAVDPDVTQGGGKRRSRKSSRKSSKQQNNRRSSRKSTKSMTSSKKGSRKGTRGRK
jgi:hypothetical protein